MNDLQNKMKAFQDGKWDTIFPSHITDKNSPEYRDLIFKLMQDADAIGFRFHWLQMKWVKK